MTRDELGRIAHDEFTRQMGWGESNREQWRCIAEAVIRAVMPMPASICEHQVQLATLAVREWDGQDDNDLLRLLSEKFGRDLTRQIKE